MLLIPGFFNSKEKHKHALFRYIVVNGMGFVMNSVGMYVAVHILGLWYLLSQAIVFIAVALNNYVLNRLWTFKKRY